MLVNHHSESAEALQICKPRCHQRVINILGGARLLLGIPDNVCGSSVQASLKPRGRRWLQAFEACPKGANQETGFPTFAWSNSCCWCRPRDYCWWWRSILAPPPSPPQLPRLRAETKVRNCHNLQQACGKRDCEKMKSSLASHTLRRLGCETRWNYVHSYSYVLCISNLLNKHFI